METLKKICKVVWNSMDVMGELMGECLEHMLKAILHALANH